MQEQEALQKMIIPSQHRAGVFLGGVIQIWVTRNCDKACFGCTQGSNLVKNPTLLEYRGPATDLLQTPEPVERFISLDNFERACRSLRNYFGVVGMFGGNPAVHPQFGELCEIMRKYIPPRQRGLWCNKLFGKGTIARETFNPAVSNLNVHLDKEAYDEFRRDWPESQPFGLDKDSRHSPPYVAMKDVIQDEGKRWELISRCDVNQRWSAMIGVFRGELRGWFCEIAGAQAMLHQHKSSYPDTGIPIGTEDNPEWWERELEDYVGQIRHHCHACGVPLRAYGELSQAEAGSEQVSQTHADVYEPKTIRPVQLIDESNLDQLRSESLPRFTDYVQNSDK